ncbi:MAG: hypothetical protein ACRDKS_15640, partial [Actinomycetota bacterium]
DTLAGAIEVAGSLPGRLGAELVETARNAFTQGLHVAATISVVGSILLAVLVLTLLRNARAGGETEEEPLAAAVDEKCVPVRRFVEPAPVEC